MGPLEGIKLIEFAGIGPAPFCSMLFSDMGAEVLRIDRPGPSEIGIRTEPKFSLLTRGRPSVAVDLKKPSGVDLALRLLERADALIEGFRPGVMERLGLGPDICLDRNEKLIYGRVTGWGQDGPLAKDAGHDLNYISLSGALHCIGPGGGKPVPPLNLLGDYGGGAMFLAFGIVSALLEVARSGRGQVVDVSMMESAAYLMTSIFGLYAAGMWSHKRGKNILDGGAPYYDVYETADGKYVCVAAIEFKFYADLLEAVGLDPQNFGDQNDPSAWDEIRNELAAAFRKYTRDEWCDRLRGRDVCFSPVLSLAEVQAHPHSRARGSFVEVEGIVQPTPSPRFSRSQPAMQSPPPESGKNTREGLSAWGITAGELRSLEREGAIVQT